MNEEVREKLSQHWGKKEPGPIDLKGIDAWVEEQIQEAMARGEFNDLPGKGRPLKLRYAHPWEEKDWLANHILSEAHIVPIWVELGEEIEAQLRWLREHPDHPERPARIQALNRLIDRYNLEVPAGWMQKPRYRDE